MSNDSGLPQEGSLDRGRDLNFDESIGGEYVVLAALVDHTEIALAFGFIVGQDRVDLVTLCYRRVAQRIGLIKYSSRRSGSRRAPGVGEDG